MKIVLINENIVEYLFNFEAKNKSFYEKTLPPRPEEYFKYE